MNTEVTDLTSVPETPEQARTMLESLRVQRLENKVKDRDYFARNDHLNEIISGDQALHPYLSFIPGLSKSMTTSFVKSWHPTQDRTGEWRCRFFSRSN